MKLNGFAIVATMLAASALSSSASAQMQSPACPTGYAPQTCGTGEVQAHCVGSRTGYPSLANRMRYARFDKISPHPHYSYSPRGIEAQHTHQWNQQQMQSYPWHCNNSYWRYGRPTALVVPANASFQSVYSWGVGNTRSVPIYHQFGRNYPGGPMAAAPGQFPATPYWPGMTTHFGVYPVRAPF